MTMIEKVAKAIMACEATDYNDLAKAAIEAMRDVDDHILDAGAYDLDMTLRSQWENIIDAALKE